MLSQWTDHVFRIPARLGLRRDFRSPFRTCASTRDTETFLNEGYRFLYPASLQHTIFKALRSCSIFFQLLLFVLFLYQPSL